MRETGYYWCKIFEDCPTWNVCYFNGVRWIVPTDITQTYPDNYFDVINETRIKNPDEKIEVWVDGKRLNTIDLDYPDKK